MISKPTLLLIVVIQVFSLKDINGFEDFIREVIVAIIAISLGGLLRLARGIEKKEIVSRKQGYRIMLIALVVGLVTDFVLYVYFPEVSRPFIVWVSSFFSEFIVIEFEKLGPNLVKSIFKAIKDSVVRFIGGNKKDTFE